MHEGHWSTVLGLPGWPRIAEDMIVARNILLSELTGARVLMQHLSSANSVRLMREAKQRGVKVYAEAMPHHIALTDASIEGYNTNFKMNPPLRERVDQEALLAGLADDTIEILASDHAPHATYEKEVEFADAPFGIVGLETELGIFAKILIEGGVLDWPRMLKKLTINPAHLLKLDRGTLAPGAIADITLINPKHAWKVDANKFESLSRNTPFQRLGTPRPRHPHHPQRQRGLEREKWVWRLTACTGYLGRKDRSRDVFHLSQMSVQSIFAVLPLRSRIRLSLSTESIT